MSVRTGDHAAMPRAVLAASLAALVLAPALLASTPPNKEQIHYTRADQAAAAAAVLRKADLGGTGWSGGRVKPEVTGSTSCPSYQPKQSDLVLTGAAETHFHQPGLDVRNIVQVLKTRSMVARDWQRTVVDPRAFACIRHAATTGLSANERLVSFRRIPFPSIATYARAYRAVVEVRGSVGTARVLLDLVLVGRGRAEVTLTIAAPTSVADAVKRADVRYAKKIVARIRG